jgi:hypothetical protein
MSTAALAIHEPSSDALGQFFEPLKVETLADLFASYRADRRRMGEIADLFAAGGEHLLEYFTRANTVDGARLLFDRLFQLDPALKALDAAYWRRALDLTDVYETMPQARREEWGKQLDKLDAPPFEETTVLSTLQDLLAQRHRFFAERVDGVFRALSHEHVTNRPEGFSKRMILNYVHSAGFVNCSKAGAIRDLRCVVAKFMGREEPRTYATNRAIEFAHRERSGEWTTLDGGALRLRVYKKGTAHLEVHPEMAWRLNSVLASIYPNAIPDAHRRRPKRSAPKEFEFFSRPLPTPVVELLMNGRMRRGSGHIFDLDFSGRTSPAYAEACAVLEALGGSPHSSGLGFEFDYPAWPVIQEVAASGVIPDQKAHQFYPTPPDLARRVVEAADIQDGHSVLEPSAGQGALAKYLPEHAMLVEVSRLHCFALLQRGFKDILAADFLTWSPGRRFDRIVMNPPFAHGQWVRHLDHASDLLASGGRLVAVLPAGARSRKDLLPGFTCTWSEPEPFPGTSIEVVMLVAERP